MKKLLLVITACATFGLLLWYRQEGQRPEVSIQVIESYEQINSIFSNVSSETLMLFDVDDTLIEGDTNDPFARGVDNLSFFVRALFLLQHPSLFISSQWESFYSLVWQHAPRFLIEPNIVHFIREAQTRGCPVLGLTTMESGSYGVITSFPEWRYNMLHNMGIDFSLTWPDTQFCNFPVYRNSKPLLYKGILCANKQPKGEVLKALLLMYHIRPSHIIFCDDSAYNLQSVGHTCKLMDIPCTLYQYRGARLHDTQFSTIVLLQKLNQLYVQYLNDFASEH